jgi:hypothetical protein
MNETVGFKWPDFKTNFKATIVKIVWYW